MRSWAPPTAEELDRLAVLLARPENRAYFFDRLENPNWVPALAKRGLFADAPDPVPAEEPGYVRFPPWPEGRYLVRVAAEAPAAVASVLQNLPANENPAVTGLLLRALANLPDDYIVRLADKAQEWVVAAPFADHFADEAAAAALRLLESGATGTALELVAQLVEVRPDPRLTEKASRRDSPLRVPPEAVARLSKWKYGRVLTRLVGPMVDTTGLGAVRLLADQLEDALRLSRWEDEEGQDDYSYIWRPAIEDHEQNVDSDIRGALVAAVRDAAIRHVTRNPDQLEATILPLESRSTVFRRIALHVLASITNGLELASARMADRGLFDDHRVRHEYATLLRARFGELDAADQSQILSWIEAGPDLDEYRQRRTASDGAPPTADEVARYADHWRRDRYSFIEDNLDHDVRARYRELVGRIGEPEHADFVSWSSSWVGPESPATADELSKRSVDGVIDYLRRWRPDDDSGRSFGPSIEGLGRVFSEVVAARATDFADLAPNLIDLDPIYVRGFFSGLESALREEVSFPWAGPLALALAVTEHPFEPDVEVEDRDRDPGWRWCRGQIGSLLRSGLTDKPNRVPFDLRATAWKVIRRLTEDPNPSAEHEARYGGDNMDPLTLSINTNRATAMHAVVEYALWCRRELESLGEDVSRGFELMPEAAEVLDRHLHPEVDASLAVRAVYGRWLPWLLLLDQAWTIERLPLLFPYQDNETLAETVWDTYIAWCPPYDSVFRALQGQYRAAIDRVPSNREAGSFGHDSVDAKLGQHLVTLYWRRVIDREVLERYFARADDRLAAVVMGFVGRALRDTAGELSDSAAERMQDLWEWRFSETAPHPEEHALELRAFGTWFASGKLDDRWALDALERTVELVGAPTFGHLVVERLVEVSQAKPVAAVRSFARMVERPEHEWDYVGWRDEAKAIVEAALASGQAEAEEPAATVVDFYVRRGELDFRELIRQRGV